MMIIFCGLLRWALPSSAISAEMTIETRITCSTKTPRQRVLQALANHHAHIHRALHNDGVRQRHREKHQH
jgi:hypothetical protein